MIEKLIEALKKDKTEGSYYWGWQSNIAMSIYDELNNKEISLFDGDGKRMSADDELRFANNCAKRFLDILTLTPKPESKSLITFSTARNKPEPL